MLMLVNQRATHGDSLSHDFLNRYRRSPQFDLAGVDPRNVDQIVRQPCQMLHLIPHDVPDTRDRGLSPPYPAIARETRPVASTDS